MTFKTHFNSIPEPGETIPGASMTIPDQALSIGEIMRRFASGLPLGGQRVPVYDDGDDMFDGVNPATLDISEKQQIIENYKEELLEIKERVKKRKKEEDTPPPPPPPPPPIKAEPIPPLGT